MGFEDPEIHSRNPKIPLGTPKFRPGTQNWCAGPALQELLGALLSSAHGPALIGCAQCPPGGPKAHPGPCDLRAVNHRLEGGAYASLQDFAQDVAAVLLRGGRGHTSPAPSPGPAPSPSPAPSLDGARELFLKLMGGAYTSRESARDPKIWSPPESPNGAPPLPVEPPSSDHTYARWRLEPAPPLSGAEGAEPAVPQAAGGGGADERQCTLCLQSGDAPAQDEGRLLYMGQNEWTHVNCALWSAEVFEEGDGTLRTCTPPWPGDGRWCGVLGQIWEIWGNLGNFGGSGLSGTCTPPWPRDGRWTLWNVHAAVARGRQMRCEHCGRPGATVGCCLAACAANYHFMCARRCQAAFLRDKRVFCQRHGRLLAGDELVRDGGFAVLRRVLVDFGGISLKRKFLGGLEPEAVNVMIGSIRIDRLGALSELSEREGRLFPVGYQCWRLYWSTRDARHCWVLAAVLEHA
ncbi:histone-lysine N-methyltransferase 2B-like [Passerculus sandwichensis]